MPTAGLRWGLIGASDIAATRMIPAIRRAGHTLNALYSGSPEWAHQYAASHGVPHVTPTLDALLDCDIDAVYVSSKNTQHADQAVAAAAAGKHVLCEKPLATTTSDATRIVDACRQASVVLAVDHHLPGAATHRRIRELVAAGAIGRPLGASVRHAVLLPDRLRGWRLSGEDGAGVIPDITVHDASVLNALFGGPPEQVVSVTARQGPGQVESGDAAMTAMVYPGCILAQTFDAFTVAHTPTEFVVYGDEGSINGIGVMTQDPDGDVVLHDRAGARRVDVGDRPDLYDVVIRDFTATVAGTGRPSVTGNEGLAACAVAAAALASSRKGEAVPVNIPQSVVQGS